MEITKKNLLKKRTDSSRKSVKYRSLIFDIPCLVVHEKQLISSTTSDVSIYFCDPKIWPEFSGNTVFSESFPLSQPIGSESIEIIIEHINTLMNKFKYEIIKFCFQ